MQVPPSTAKVAGFLWVPIILSLVISPLAAIGIVANEISTAERLNPALRAYDFWIEYKAWTWLITICGASCVAYSGWRLLYKLVPSTVQFFLATTWLVTPISAALIYIAGRHVFGSDFSYPAKDVYLELLRTVFGGVLWTAYFTNSKRVKETYYQLALNVDARKSEGECATLLKPEKVIHNELNLKTKRSSDSEEMKEIVKHNGPESKMSEPLLYDGKDSEVSRKISNILSFSLDWEEIHALLLAEGDLNIRSRLIEQACAADYPRFLGLLREHFEGKLARLRFSDPHVLQEVVRLLQEIKEQSPMKFCEAYSTAVDLGDGLNIEAYKGMFASQSNRRPMKEKDRLEIIEIIFRKKPPGERLVELLNQLGYPSTVSWTSKGGVYEMEANGKRYQNQSWDEIFYLLRTEVLTKEFQGLSIN
jgi:arsenate reductase-like glutaredoxin family protein